MLKTIQPDLSAAVVVFLIALPLSMGIAIASGVAPALGLVTAVIGGIVVGILGGAPLQISGPSAGLTVLVLQMHQEHGMATFAVIVIVAGILQTIAGIFKIGRQFQAVSPAVIRGMLTGIGVLIFLGQFHVMLDREIPGNGIDNVLAIPSAIWSTITEHNDLAHDEAALIGVGTLIVVTLWERRKKGRLSIVPGPLVGVLLAGISAAVLRLPIRYVAIPGELADLLTFPTTETLAVLFDSGIWGPALGLAFVASAETLLCAAAVSRMHNRGATDYDRELTAHGVANTLCGLVGTLPMTGVISRSTANVGAGAQTKWSAVIHAVLIASFVLFLPDLLALVPMSSLAAILIYIGFKLVNRDAVRKLARFGWPVMAIFGVTFVGVVAVDLLKGILAGLILSAIRLMYQMSHVSFELKKTPDPDGPGPALERWDLHLRGSASFLAVPKLQDVLAQVDEGVELHVHFEDLEFIDHASLDLLDEFRRRHEASGGKVVVEWDELFSRRGKTVSRRNSNDAASDTVGPRP